MCSVAHANASASRRRCGNKVDAGPYFQTIYSRRAKRWPAAGKREGKERRGFRMIDEYQLDFTQLNPFASIVIFAGFI
jgi:hypothetical protein